MARIQNEDELRLIIRKLAEGDRESIKWEEIHGLQSELLKNIAAIIPPEALTPALTLIEELIHLGCSADMSDNEQAWDYSQTYREVETMLESSGMLSYGGEGVSPDQHVMAIGAMGYLRQLAWTTRV